MHAADVTPERHRQVQSVFADAVERPSAERAAFLDAACAGDAALRARVDALLAADTEVSDAEASGTDAPGLLGAPLPELAAMLVDGGPDTSIVPVGHTLGDYEVVRELGRGGMATVYLAQDRKHDRLVALKTLYPDLAASLGPERFKREIRTAARLQHPHVLTLLDSGETDGRLWFTMPYVEGETLRARLRRDGPLPIEDVVRAVREVALALEYAHARGVVHRDIKPENVLLSGGAAVVADFGVAKAIAAAGAGPATDRVGTGLTGAGAALGTPAYMAPEQAIGDPSADQRADLYSLGCVAYELLAGRPPFIADTPWYLVRAHIDETPEPVARYRPDVPPALAALVMRCLEKDPAARPPTAAAVVAALDALPAAPPAAVPSTLPLAPVARPQARRPRWTRGTIAGFVGGLVIAGSILAAARVPAPLRAMFATLLTRPDATLNPRRVVVAPLDNRTGDSAFSALGAMAADWVTQELMRTGEFEVVDPRTAATASAVLARVPRPLRDGDPAVALAKETGAGRVVTGGIDRVGDSLRLQVQLVDVASGRLLRAVPAVTGSARAPGAAVTALARRAVAELAATVDTAIGAGAASVGRPPSYEAYREVSRAVESYFRGDRKDHDVRLAHAAALDSTYALPLLLATWAAEDERRWADADSLMRRVTRLDTLLTPSERDQRDVLAAGLAGDQRGQLRAAETLFARSPGSAEVALVVAQSAVRINHPAAALAALDGTDPERGLNLVSPWYWIYRGAALHQLGRYQEELDAAGRGRRQFPQAAGVRLVAVRALAALGRAADVERELAEDPQLGAGTIAANAYRLEARVLAAERELRAHGHMADAARVLDTALARWGLAGPGAAAAVRADSVQAADRGSASDGALYRAELLYDAGRWDDARQIVAARAADTADFAGPGRLGTIAARTGDRAGAERIAARLAASRRPYAFGRAALWRARIAALLGDRPTAVALLERAVGEGESMALPDRGVRGANFHTDPDLAGLRGYAPFEALMTPQR